MTTFEPTSVIPKIVLDSLEVKNFRAFKHITVTQLGRVNLITGKNNVGKSSLLEAIWLYANRGFPFYIWELLSMRNESVRAKHVRGRLGSIEEEQISPIKFLFYGRKDVREHLSTIQIGSAKSSNNNLSISVKWYVSEENEDGEDVLKSIKLSDISAAENPVPRIVVKFGEESTYRYTFGSTSSGSLLMGKQHNRKIHCVFVRTNGLTSQEISEFWDNITLTDLQQDVVNAMQILSSDAVGVGLRGNQEAPEERTPIVRMKNLDSPLPLRSIGEGMNRMFAIALALVNAKDGLLLLDEVDIGLHYSVLPDMWRLVFETSRRLNVQVFTTTHSWECIEAFQEAAEEDKQDEGVLIRLQDKGGDVTATVFDERRLAVATREQIEVR
jgi:hypothetical protein